MRRAQHLCFVVAWALAGSGATPASAIELAQYQTAPQYWPAPQYPTAPLYWPATPAPPYQRPAPAYRQPLQVPGRRFMSPDPMTATITATARKRNV